MKLAFVISILFIFSALFFYLSSSTVAERIDTPDAIKQTDEPSLPTIIDIDAPTGGLENKDQVIQIDRNEQVLDQQALGSDIDSADSLVEGPVDADSSISDNDTLAQHSDVDDAIPNNKLPGEDVNFRLKLDTSNYHEVDGRANSDIGKVLFKSRLMPSNEVKLSMKLKQGELDDIELLAYVDLVNFTMELDGAGGVLNKDHKQLLKFSSMHLRSQFVIQYDGYDYPEHVLVLVQMLDYWSVSPTGFAHEKRTIISE